MGDIHEQTIVISDLLSFLSCKIKLISKDKLLKTLRHFYKEKEINEAHRTLLASLPEKKSTRHGRRVKHPDPLIAMYDSFQLIPEQDLPIFVCKNLNNVPELDVIKEEPPDLTEPEEFDDETEVEIETGVEQVLREEQKTMKSQIADIAFVVKQLKEQLDTLSTSSIKSEENSGVKLKRKEDLNFKPSKKFLSESHTEIPNCNVKSVKKKGLAYLQSLIDEDEGKSDKEQSEKEVDSDFQDDVGFSDFEFDYEESRNPDSVACEVLLKEETDASKPRTMAKYRAKNEIFLASPSPLGQEEGRLKGRTRELGKGLDQKVIYIKNEDERYFDEEEEENSIEITPASDYLGQLEDTDPSSRISFEMCNEEEDFIGEIELMVVGGNDTGLPKEGRESNVCSICSVAFPTQKKLDLHVKTHCIKKVFECVLCDEGFASKEKLRLHFQDCLEATKKKYNLDAFPCPTCGRLYAQERALKQHSYVHSQSRPFACMHCTYRYLTKSSLQAHIKTQHNELNKFFCPFCDNSYISSGFLKNHIRSHTGERPFACQECGYKASTADLLKRHMLTHGPPKEYKCPICHITCVGIGKLSRHKAKEHKRENIFCTICGKEFNNSCVYHKHYLSHVGARPFPCTVCSYAAISKEVLMVHMRTHTGDNILHCPNCAVPFGTNYSLKRHLKSYCLNKTGYFNTEFAVEGAI